MNGNPRPRHCLTLIFAMTLLVSASMDIYIPLAPRLAQVFEASDQSLKLTFLFGPLSCCLVSLPFGFYSDIKGRRPLILLGLALFQVGTFLCLISSGIVLFSLGRLIQSLGIAGLSALTSTTLADLFHGRSLARHLGTYACLFPIAFSLAPIIGTQIDHYFGWRAVFLFLFLAMGLISLGVVFLLPETSSQVQKDRNLAVALKELFTSRKFQLLLMVHSLPITLGALFTINGPFLYQNVYHIDAVTFSLILAVPVAAQFLGGLLYRQVVVRVGLRRCMLAGVILSLLFSALCFTTLSSSPYYPVSLVTLFTGGATFTIASAGTLLFDSSRFSKGLTGAFILLGKNGIITLVLFLGSFLPNDTIKPLQLLMAGVALMIAVLILSVMNSRQLTHDRV